MLLTPFQCKNQFFSYRLIFMWINPGFGTIYYMKSMYVLLLVCILFITVITNL